MSIAKAHLTFVKKYWFDCTKTVLLRKIEVGPEWEELTVMDPRPDYPDPLTPEDFMKSQGTHSDFDAFVKTLPQIPGP